MILLNAFSANMLAELPCTVTFKEVTIREAGDHLEYGFFQSAVGHADTAALFESILGLKVPVRRINVTLKKGDQAIVGQYSGPRLPEGCTSLPEGATIKWLHVEVS